jgi:RimJ/RimL family protein N-acetyltransferase
MDLKGKVIQGKNIHLRPLDMADVKSITRWHSDREIMALFALTTAGSEKYWSEWLDKKLMSPNTIYFGVVKKNDDRLIGYIHLEEIYWSHKLCRDLGILIGEKGEWSKGYGTEAMELMMRYAFEELGLHRLELMTFDFNKRGMRVWEKCGFTQEGMMRKARLANGEWRDLIFYALLEDEYRGRN